MSDRANLIVGELIGGRKPHYYVTFEFDGGDREEFSVGASDYGMLAEGGVGTLRSQGSWYQGFQRMLTRG